MDKLIIARTEQELAELSEYLKDKDFVAFDTETTGLEKESQVIGFSVCAEVGDTSVGYYVILSHWDVNLSKLVDLPTKALAPAFMKDLLPKSLIMHNAVFDCIMVNSNFGVDLMPSLHTDTMILGHLLNENRSNGLKERAVELYGEDVRKEQAEMKESVHKNGGMLTKANYELYKADADLIAKYGAQDAILTLKLFYNDVPQLYEEKLDKFFYEDESMPLLRGPTYDLNTTGLRVDPQKLQTLKQTLEAEILDARAFIYREIQSTIAEEYPGTSKAKTFNIGSSSQLSWLLFIKMEQEFHVLTKQGKLVCKALGMKLPYTAGAKREFIQRCREAEGEVWEESSVNRKTKKMSRAKKVRKPEYYIACGKETLAKYAPRYKWVERFLQYAKNQKLLNTYVCGIESRMRYNVIRPNFLQHGTTSGRYACRNPNFQNLPRDDKRVKGCIVARPGKVFVGADYSQLEPRVFASFSGDTRLLDCFKNGDDFYSVIGVDVFDKHGCSLKKDDKDSFAKLYPKLRQDAKVIALAATYGTTAPKMAPALGKSMDEAQEIIDNYFERFPSVRQLMLDSHTQAKTQGRVENLFGRPRRMPQAMEILQLFGDNEDLPYEWRNLLNLAVNHRIQSTGASIINRAGVAFCASRALMAEDDPRWLEVKIVLQVHDELILETPEDLAEDAKAILKVCMEHTVALPGVDLIADPAIASNLADLK